MQAHLSAFSAFLVAFVIALVAFRLTGIGPEAAFAVVLVLNLQQTVSHMNVDLRVGPLNQVLIGAETHRFHHSAVDTGNFSAAITLWDKVFGTFVHRPGQVPERLGLADPGDYEAPEEFHRVLAYPFRRGAPGRASA